MNFQIALVFLPLFQSVVADKGNPGTNTNANNETTVKITFGECGNVVLISDEKNATYNFSSPFNETNSQFYPSGGVCKWEFIGDPTCTVQILCESTDLLEPTTEKCTKDDEHLQIYDGTGGSERFCGKSNFEVPIVASSGLRDLYANFKVSNSPNVTRNGFNCQLTCTNDTSKARPLKITRKRKDNPKCVCGIKQKAKTRRRKRVVSGSDAGLNEWPWQVAIVKPGTRTSFCGGAILNSRFILTAAHCFYFNKMKPDQVEILLHAKQLDRTDKKEFRVRKPPESAMIKYQEKLKKLLGGGEVPGGLNNFSAPSNVQNFSAPTNIQNVSAPGGPSSVGSDPLKPKLPPVGGEKPPGTKGGKPESSTAKPGLPLGKSILPGGLEGILRQRRSPEKQAGDPLDPFGKLKEPDGGGGEEKVVKLQNLTDKEERSRRFKVKSITTHPLFTTAYDFDVAVIELDGEIPLKSETVDDHTSLCLPKLGYEQKFVGAHPWVVGWGLTREDENVTDGTLHQLSVNVFDTVKCQNWTQYELTTRMLCAGYEKGSKDACVGDSGGPLNYENNKKQWSQIGIVSWGEGCARAMKPGMYARVTELNQWIQHHTLENGKWCKDSPGD